MTLRLDVNLFDASEEKAKKTNCVPLKDFDISGKTLGDIRKALIDNGGLDASRAGSAFCSAAGAQTVEEKEETEAKEEKEEKEEKKETEEEKKKGEAEKEKSQKPAKATIHNIYIKAKEKKSTDRTAEAKELITKELNLKLSDKPELLKISLDQLASSFNRADWVAAGNKTTVNPADMSEKDWNAVIRNNNLLSAHRLVFSNLGRLSDGTKQVKFRRIERAPYSAFVLKPRKFALHEIPGADVKVEQEFHIPRFTVGDDAYVDAFETKSSVASAMARSSFSSVEAEASLSGGAFGFSAAVSAGFSESESSALSTQNTTDSSTMNITYNFPRVVLYLDQFGVGLSKECADDLEDVKDAASLVAFHHKYGHFFATRMELGGRLFSSEKFSSLGSKTETEAATAMKIAASASFSSKYVSGSASYGQEDQTNSNSSNSNRSMQSSISWQAQGGDTLLCNNPPAWCPTVAPSQNWRVIKQEDVTPLGDFIGQLHGYEDIPKKFKSIAEVTREKKTVSFRISLVDWQRDAPTRPEYLALHHAWKLKGDVEEAMGKIGEEANVANFKVTIMKNQIAPDPIMDIYNNGYPGLCFMENSEEDVFDVEVETLLNQDPALEFRRRYHLYNRKTRLWLRSFTIRVKGEEVTLLAGGPKSQATLFEFREKQREGAIRNGDSCSLMVYGPDGRQKGTIAKSLESPATSIGAMHYSVSREARLRFSTLMLVDQEDVPV
ncbi:hypothetical protein BJX70DRAFT_402421 [Aspergillus crustosus]